MGFLFKKTFTLCSSNPALRNQQTQASSLAVSEIVLEDPKEFEDINSTAANTLSSDQRCTVTEIKSDWFNIRLDAK